MSVFALTVSIHVWILFVSLVVLIAISSWITLSIFSGVDYRTGYVAGFTEGAKRGAAMKGEIFSGPISVQTIMGDKEAKQIADAVYRKRPVDFRDSRQHMADWWIEDNLPSLKWHSGSFSVLRLSDNVTRTYREDPHRIYIRDLRAKAVLGSICNQPAILSDLKWISR